MATPMFAPDAEGDEEADAAEDGDLVALGAVARAVAAAVAEGGRHLWRGLADGLVQLVLVDEALFIITFTNQPEKQSE